MSTLVHIVERGTGREWIERELAKDEYSANDLTPLELIGRWLTDTWNTLLTTALRGNSPWLLLLVLAAVAAIAALIVWRVRRLGMRRAAMPLTAFGALVAAPEPGPWRESARAAAARGDLRGALIDEARAIFAVLARADILAVDGASTASEIGRIAARALPAHGPELTRVATVFNDLAFGPDSPGTAPSEEELRRLYADFLTLDGELSRLPRRAGRQETEAPR